MRVLWWRGKPIERARRGGVWVGMRGACVGGIGRAKAQRGEVMSYEKRCLG